MTEKITIFIQAQTAATVCCIDENGMPYCFSCFYAYNETEQLLYFKSSADTRHAVIFLQNPQLAGTIVPDKLKKLVVQGIQFQGVLLNTTDALAQNAATRYYQRHPMAMAVPGIVWTIQLNKIKMTDSTMGFGKKIIWLREP